MIRFLSIIPILFLFACQDDDQITFQPNLIESPSFENSTTGLNSLPIGWENCGDLLPDIFPVSGEENTRQCDKTAFEGTNYIGLKVNENGEMSCLNYLFTESIMAGDSLSMSISIARSTTYLMEINGEMKNFATPLQLEVYGITSSEDILLHTTTNVINSRWLTFSTTVPLVVELKGFLLRPKYIDSTPYNGNLLIDNLDFRVIL